MSQKCAIEMTKDEKRDFYKTHGIFGLMSGDNIKMSVVQKELQENIENLLDENPDNLVDLHRLFAPKNT